MSTMKGTATLEPQKGTNMKYFTNCKTIDELKAEYRRLAMKHHPDRGGDEETMKAINAEYDKAFNAMQHGEQYTESADGKTESRKQQYTETPEEFRDIIDKLIRMGGLEIDICGWWVWIGGNTYAHREELKEAGCHYASNKKLWYWHSPEHACTNRRKTSMNTIRFKYGSTVITVITGSANAVATV